MNGKQNQRHRGKYFNDLYSVGNSHEKWLPFWLYLSPTQHSRVALFWTIFSVLLCLPSGKLYKPHPPLPRNVCPWSANEAGIVKIKIRSTIKNQHRLSILCVSFVGSTTEHNEVVLFAFTSFSIIYVSIKKEKDVCRQKWLPSSKENTFA